MWRLMQNDAYTALVDLEHLHNTIVLLLLWMVKKDFETTINFKILQFGEG